MPVRAKFRVDEIKRHHGSRKKLDADGKPVKTEYRNDVYEPCEIRSVVLTPVCATADPEHENSKFWQASPSGRIELGCANLDAAGAFELGKEYYVDFTPADPPPTDDQAPADLPAGPATPEPDGPDGPDGLDGPDEPDGPDGLDALPGPQAPPANP
jgi:hypothetical protein